MSARIWGPPSYSLNTLKIFFSCSSLKFYDNLPFNRSDMHGAFNWIKIPKLHLAPVKWKKKIMHVPLFPKAEGLDWLKLIPDVLLQNCSKSVKYILRRSLEQNKPSYVSKYCNRSLVQYMRSILLYRRTPWLEIAQGNSWSFPSTAVADLKRHLSR